MLTWTAESGALYGGAPARQITNGWRLRGLRPLRRTRRGRLEAGDVVAVSKVGPALEVVARRVANLETLSEIRLALKSENDPETRRDGAMVRLGKLMPHVIVVAAVALTAPGCGLVAPDVWEERRELFERNVERWRNQRIRAYQYTSTTSCECIPGFVGPVEITVEENQVTSLTPLRDSEAVPEEHWNAFDTVEDAFDRIGSALDRRAHRFDVTYDPALGYPTQVTLDINEEMADDELLIVISDLTILERDE